MIVMRTGEWEHGFFSLVAVGATNVGSIKINFDSDLETNKSKLEKKTFHQKRFHVSKAQCPNQRYLQYHELFLGYRR